MPTLLPKPKPPPTKRVVGAAKVRSAAKGHAPCWEELRRGLLVAGKYRLKSLIARGGMGAVWAAWDTALEREVAVKFMDPSIAANPQLRGRFEQEAKAAARLQTPHVVQVYEHGVDGGMPYIVMELLQGQDLHTRIQLKGRMPLRHCSRVVVQAAKGLRAAHEAGIIHRDLKPQNVFLGVQDGELVVKILDFGVAKVGTSKVGEGTEAGKVLGSPHYWSPEQARGLPTVDHRSDLWSLAAVTYRMVTGDMPFKGEATGDIIVSICSKPLPRPRAVVPDLPPQLERFFRKGFERHPNMRFQSAIELAQAFVQAVRAGSEARQGSAARAGVGAAQASAGRAATVAASRQPASSASAPPESALQTPVTGASVGGISGSLPPSPIGLGPHFAPRGLVSRTVGFGALAASVVLLVMAGGFVLLGRSGEATPTTSADTNGRSGSEPVAPTLADEPLLAADTEPSSSAAVDPDAAALDDDETSDDEAEPDAGELDGDAAGPDAGEADDEADGAAPAAARAAPRAAPSRAQRPAATRQRPTATRQRPTATPPPPAYQPRPNRPRGEPDWGY